MGGRIAFDVVLWLLTPHLQRSMSITASIEIVQIDKKASTGVVMLLIRVGPWGVEPQSKEPESFILSIELWAQATFL